jgi:hypothetical protein
MRFLLTRHRSAAGAEYNVKTARLINSNSNSNCGLVSKFYTAGEASIKSRTSGLPRKLICNEIPAMWLTFIIDLFDFCSVWLVFKLSCLYIANWKNIWILFGNIFDRSWTIRSLRNAPSFSDAAEAPWKLGGGTADMKGHLSQQTL